jgi:tripartite-type tricarboxylate transporter receptor subunit TctC
MKLKMGLSTIAIVALILVGRLPAAAADDFYSGKTIRFIVGFAAGGGFDTYSRMIARHIGKHIPGHPSTVVENMTGAGSLVAANYIYNRAEPDGLTIGNFIVHWACSMRWETKQRSSIAENLSGWEFPRPIPVSAF